MCGDFQHDQKLSEESDRPQCGIHCIGRDSVFRYFVAAVDMTSMLAPLHSPLEDTTKVRGGWRTRDAVEVAAAASRSPRRTVGVNRMLLSWAKGHNSTHELWWQSDGHVQDGSTVPGLVRLSRLGALNSDKACFANMMKLLRICNICKRLQLIEMCILCNICKLSEVANFAKM